MPLKCLREKQRPVDFLLIPVFAVRTFFPQAVHIQIKRVILDGKSALLGDALLALFDFGIAELFHPATLQADQVVVVSALVEFEYGFAGFKVMAFQQTCLLELRQHTIDGCQPDVLVVLDQLAVDIFGGEVLQPGVLEQFQDFETGKSGLETDVLEAAGVIYHDPNPVARVGGRCCVCRYVIFPHLF